MNMVNLTALAVTRAKMTPGEWSVLIGSACDPHDDEACGIASSQWRQTLRGRDEAVFRSDAYDECSHPIARADAQGIAAEHNAIGVLIEVARAAMAHRDAHAALDTAERYELHVGAVSFSALIGRDEFADLKVKINDTGAALLAALAKVSL